MVLSLFINQGHCQTKVIEGFVIDGSGDTPTEEIAVEDTDDYYTQEDTNEEKAVQETDEITADEITIDDKEDTSTEEITPPSTTPDNFYVLDEESEVTVDNFEDFIVVEDTEEDDFGEESGDEGSAEVGSVGEEEGSGDFNEEEAGEEDICATSDEDNNFAVEIATYAMTTSADIGMDIEIQLHRMSDSSIQMLCKMQEKIKDDLEVNDTVETTTEPDKTTTTRSILPATIYLIQNSGVCSDISSAISNNIVANVLELAQVTGTGEAKEKLAGVTWEDIKQSQCIALLQQKDTSDGVEAVGDITTTASTDEATITTIGPEEVTTIQRRDLRRRTPRCIRRRSILQSSRLGRVFTSISLASYALVSVGVTGKNKTILPQ